VFVTVVGLLVVAVLLTLLTVWYWRHTKPVPRSTPPSSGDDRDDIADLRATDDTRAFARSR
jgi:hypothetical protein